MAAWTAGVPLGPYLLLAPIGAGGMGEVWKARDTRLDRIVAVKRLKGQQVSASGKARFEQEARAIAALNHPNICTLHDVGADYLVMEYIEGHSPNGPMPLSDALAVAAQIADALVEAHAHGILHRDLKPANILITPKGAVKLLDFGLAKITIDSAATQTLSGAILGTPLYMSPEQAEGKPLDARSDIFSFGAVLYEILTGVRAFDSLAALLRDQPTPFESPAAELVMRCMAKQASGRFQSMADIRAALQNVSAKPPERRPSIAVLPFANMSRDADDEYFSDGLAEEILNVLAQVSGLKVIARTSAFAFKGKNEDVRGIAEALGVTNILEGSVRRAGSRIRITAQLIHAADGSHLWSQRYDRELTDVFAVQDEIAAAIAGTLRLKLIGKQAASRPHQPNLPAYEAFLKGSQQYSKFSPEGFARAEEYYKQAIVLDPQWADPHSALARQYFSLANNALRPLSEMIPLARAEALKALELLPSEPGAHAVLGGIASAHDYDWKEAEDQFRLAREAAEAPTPEVCAWHAMFYLAPLGRFEEAIEEGSKAIAHDPMNSLSYMNLSLTLVFAGMYERAIAEAEKALALDDRSFLAPLVIALGEFHQGKHAQAREQAEEAFRIAPWHPMVAGFLAGILAQNGEVQQAEELIAKMPDGNVLYRMLGSEIDPAIDAYAQVIEARHPIAAMMASANLFEPLRCSPRWLRLAKMMNLPEQ
jgi:serine/threonine-protein kinase